MSVSAPLRRLKGLYATGVVATSQSCGSVSVPCDGALQWRALPLVAEFGELWLPPLTF
jgi:hypothetical protein